MKKEWTIRQLEAEMVKDLAMCSNEFERSMVRAISGKEIRERRELKK